LFTINYSDFFSSHNYYGKRYYCIDTLTRFRFLTVRNDEGCKKINTCNSMIDLPKLRARANLVNSWKQH